MLVTIFLPISSITVPTAHVKVLPLNKGQFWEGINLFIPPLVMPLIVWSHSCSDAGLRFNDHLPGLPELVHLSFLLSLALEENLLL